jgi:cell division septal protein FtsQ
LFKKDVIFFPLFKKISIIIASILFAGIVIAYIFIGSNLFLIREIEILNSDLIDEENLFRFKNKNIFLVRLDVLIKGINDIPEVKSVVIKKKLPHKLAIEVEEYVPCALLKENMKLAVSKEGTIFPFRGSSKEAYPLFVYEKQNKKEDLPLGKSFVGLERAMKTYLSIKDIVPVEIIKVKTETEVFFLLKNTKTEIRMDSEEYEKESYYLAALM